MMPRPATHRFGVGIVAMALAMAPQVWGAWGADSLHLVIGRGGSSLAVDSLRDGVRQNLVATLGPRYAVLETVAMMADSSLPEPAYPAGQARELVVWLREWNADSVVLRWGVWDRAQMAWQRQGRELAAIATPDLDRRWSGLLAASLDTVPATAVSGLPTAPFGEPGGVLEGARPQLAPDPSPQARDPQNPWRLVLRTSVGSLGEIAQGRTDPSGARRMASGAVGGGWNQGGWELLVGGGAGGAWGGASSSGNFWFDSYYASVAFRVPDWMLFLFWVAMEMIGTTHGFIWGSATPSTSKHDPDPDALHLQMGLELGRIDYYGVPRLEYQYAPEGAENISVRRDFSASVLRPFLALKWRTPKFGFRLGIGIESIQVDPSPPPAGKWAMASERISGIGVPFWFEVSLRP